MSVKTDSILDKDLYELFGVLHNASVKDIKTAYRKKALECHPDKNPDNPKANELFHELSRALAVLIDQSARAAYDKLLNAKLAAKQRHQVLDSRRKKFKEELEERERQAKIYTPDDFKADEEKFQKELDRLRKLSSKQVEEELNYVRMLIKERKAYNNDAYSQGIYRIKIKWSAKDSADNAIYTYESLNKIFSKYGSVIGIALSKKKKGSALVEFSEMKAAMNAYSLEKGHIDNPLVISWVGLPPKAQPPVIITRNKPNEYESAPNESKAESSFHINHPVEESDDDFEAAVLRKLREAEEEKNS